MAKHIIINESQLHLFEDAVLKKEPGKLKKINDEKADLENYIERCGEYMTDVTNGKTYLVQYLKALSGLVGKKYAMCAPVRKDGTYGAFYVKPYETFQRHVGGAMSDDSENMVPMQIKPNFYQQMGLNK